MIGVRWLVGGLIGFWLACRNTVARRSSSNSKSNSDGSNRSHSKHNYDHSRYDFKDRGPVLEVIVSRMRYISCNLDKATAAVAVVVVFVVVMMIVVILVILVMLY